MPLALPDGIRLAAGAYLAKYCISVWAPDIVAPYGNVPLDRSFGAGHPNSSDALSDGGCSAELV